MGRVCLLLPIILVYILLIVTWALLFAQYNDHIFHDKESKGRHPVPCDAGGGFSISFPAKHLAISDLEEGRESLPLLDKMLC